MYFWIKKVIKENILEQLGFRFGTVDVSVEPSAHYVIADPVVEFMEGLASPSARKALSTGFGHEDDPPLKAAP